MNEFRADLHCHTTCSDGTTPPCEIIQMAFDLGLQGLSITDHDTIEAYKEAKPFSETLQISLISGVEFSSIHCHTHIHILAYSFPLSSSLITEFCQRHAQRRVNRNLKILELLTSKGMPINQDELSTEIKPEHSLGRPHIALAMVKKGYVTSVQQAFQNFIGEGKPCYIAGESFSVEETLETIHKAKGLAIIAHPHLIKNRQILNDLFHMNFDGIEGYYARFPHTANANWLKVGARKGWIITGGSDFHGEFTPHVTLGSSWINEETFSLLLRHFENNQQSFH